MKNVFLAVLTAFILFGCNDCEKQRKAYTESLSNYKDSISYLNDKINMYEGAFESRNEVIDLLKDSIQRLNDKPLMTTEHFKKIYKYDRLCKYYRICERDPSQWVFWKGWSRRVFKE
jgi:septal ring factor EnvC (AmiA/AmiB activator)